MAHQQKDTGNMAKKKYIIPSEDALRTIRERLDYDGKRGRLVWKVDIPRWGITAGDEAGCAKQHAAGHREHQVKVAGRQYASARVAWFLAEGAWPTGSVIPLNGDQHDLRSVNLAMALNLRRAERGVQYRGVSWDKSSQRWLAGIYGGGRRRHLGRFADPREAALAYDRAALELRGAAAVLNFPSAPTGRVPKAPAWTAPASIGTPCEGPRP